MKKLNNKGMTAVEILVCFVLVVIISVSMYTTVSSYQNKQQIEAFKEKIFTYKNLLTKEINDDLIKDGLVTAKMDELQVADAMTEIFNVLRASNKYIDDTMPWALAKDETQQDRLETVLYNLLESIRVCGSMLEAFMPDTSASVLSQINSTDKSYTFNENSSYELGQPSPLFQRMRFLKYQPFYSSALPQS